MQFNEEEFYEFRQHVMRSNGQFTVFFGDDYVAFDYGDGKQFAVGLPPHAGSVGPADKRMLAIVTAAQVFTLMGSKAASSAVSVLTDE